MNARDTLAETVELTNRGQASASRVADAVLAAIRGMSHDELRELRPDIAILFDTARDTANARGTYILRHNQARDGQHITIELAPDSDTP